jgi:hypothetical protein
MDDFESLCYNIDKQEPEKEECPSCFWQWRWEAECCNWGWWCSCNGSRVDMWICLVCKWKWFIYKGKADLDANWKSITTPYLWSWPRF